MKENYIHKSKYFYGNEISEYGLKNGYVDYKTLAKSFDAVMVNDITKLFYSEVNGEYSEAEMVNGYIDNSEEIEELQEQLEEIAVKQSKMIDDDKEETEEYEILENQYNELYEKIEELEREQEEVSEIFQYFIISDYGAEILQDLTNEIVYYLPVLDCYIWGVTHWGTSWDYVLTDIKINLED